MACFKSRVQDLNSRRDCRAGIVKVLLKLEAHFYVVLDNVLLFVLICGCQEKKLDLHCLHLMMISDAP